MYSAKLWRDPPKGAVDPLFVEALYAESVRVTGQRFAAESILAQRVVATAHHVTPTNGPGFLGADWITSTGAPAPVVVLAWSGVALSNTAWSGALSATTPILKPNSPSAHRARRAQSDRCRDAGNTELRVSLFPSRMRDSLLYRAAIPQRVHAVLQDMLPSARALFAEPSACEDYPTWALHSCAAIEAAVLGHRLIYLDACRLMADYIALALENPEHPMSRLLDAPEQVADRLPALSWFLARHRNRVAVLRPCEGGFAGRGVAVPRAAVAEQLREGTLCPGLVPAFVGLACINPLRCLGSFNQVRYLTELQRVWGGMADAQPTLIAGRAPGYPLDLALSETPLPAGDAVEMGTLWARLLG